MLVYRITTAKWASQLTGSGHPARWNSEGKFVLYTAGSRALACLENLVHRSGEGLHNRFKIAKIHIPDLVPKTALDSSRLKDGWHLHPEYPYCQSIGDQWIEKKETCVMEVPSSIIKEEINVLINPDHSDFNQINIQSIDDFIFDNRLISE